MERRRLRAVLSILKTSWVELSAFGPAGAAFPQQISRRLKLRGLEMVALKELSVLAAAIVGAGLFMIHPARALTAIEQSHSISIHQTRVSSARAVTDGRRHHHQRACDYRQGGSQHYCKSRKKSGYYRYGPAQNPSYHKPWRGHEPCANCPAIK
jgi:hypothetical protein